MQSKPKLPIEVCERIIDCLPAFIGFPCWDWPNFGTERRTLYTCALVCRDWVPRSQHNLFCQVELCTTRQAHAFLDIVTRFPHRAKLVQSLSISPAPYGTSRLVLPKKPSNPPCYYNWIYQALERLPHLLVNLSLLDLRSLPTLHPSFVHRASRFKTVKALSFFDLSEQSFSEIIQIVYRLPRLESLQMGYCSWNQSARFFSRNRPRVKKLHLPSISQETSIDLLNWLGSIQDLSHLDTLCMRIPSLSESRIQLHHILRRCMYSLRSLFLDLDFVDGDPFGKPEHTS